MGRRKRRPGSRRWLDEHHSDHWVQQAQKAGYRSRAAFKLLEIQEKDRLIRPGMTVVDLGAAPGGWCQVAAELVGDRGAVFALDILPMEALPGVHVIQGDFTEEAPCRRCSRRWRVGQWTWCSPTWPRTSPVSGWWISRGPCIWRNLHLTLQVKYYNRAVIF